MYLHSNTYSHMYVYTCTHTHTHTHTYLFCFLIHCHDAVISNAKKSWNQFVSALHFLFHMKKRHTVSLEGTAQLNVAEFSLQLTQHRQLFILLQYQYTTEHSSQQYGTHNNIMALITTIWRSSQQYGAHHYNMALITAI